MKQTKSFLTIGLSFSVFFLVLSVHAVSAQILHVDSVKVDTVWNTDSSWTDGSGAAKHRVSRDCKISFVAQGEGTALMSVAMSLDSGKTFSPFSDSITVKNYALFAPFATGKKATITARVLGGDRVGVAFKLTARQEAPVIAGNPKVNVLGPIGALTPGATIAPLLSVLQAGDATSFGYCSIAKIQWDTLGNGKYDSTTAGVLTWTWHTKVPAGASAQTRNVIARAIDKNGLVSDPETLSVQFGLKRPIVMKNIAAGSFSMGETGIAEPVHQVTLAAFAMQETPVTQEQYLAVRGVNPAYSLGDLTRPVENVSWCDAVLFCNSLSKLANLDTCYSYTAIGATDAVCDFAKKGYRLPTEAEWEYACRGGTTTTYWWGADTVGMGARVFTPNYGDVSTTASVATKLPNGFGLYDIVGNGWKWCNDWQSTTYYASSPASNPQGPTTGSTRILRGGAFIGSFFVLGDYYKSAFRANMNPTVTNSYCGFACAMTK